MNDEKILKALICQATLDKTGTELREANKEIMERLASWGYETETAISTLPHVPLKSLGSYLEILANYDMVYFVHGWDKSRVCRIMFYVCGEYGIETAEEKEPPKVA